MVKKSSSTIYRRRGCVTFNSLPHEFGGILCFGKLREMVTQKLTCCWFLSRCEPVSLSLTGALTEGPQGQGRWKESQQVEWVWG